MTATAQYDQLLEKYREFRDLASAEALLSWDQETYMPAGAAAARARILQTLSGLSHRLFTAPEIGKLLETLGNGASKSLTPIQNKTIEVMRREYDKATLLPESLVRELAEASSIGLEAWRTARKNKDFSQFRDALQRNVDLARKKADILGKAPSSKAVTQYDALLDLFEPRITEGRVTALFQVVRDRTVALLKRVMESKKKTTSEPFTRNLPIDKQVTMTERALRDMGFDFNKGRQDQSTHPFSTGLDVSDVRVTTRFQEDWMPMALYASLHEGGHALYEQGLDKEKVGAILAEATSMGMHESQSRLWENIVGRSEGYWKYYTPIVKEHFAPVLNDLTPRAAYEAVNVVEPSFIRVEADELTYNLHIILRFELESDLIAGEAKVKDVPEMWNAKMKEYLGIVPPDDSQGCLQDIHWSQGYFGYFPSYTLGNLYSAPIMAAAEKALGPLEPMYARGEFKPLRKWLADNVHSVGRSMFPEELAKHVTGRPLEPNPYMDYLEKKFSAIYDLK